MERVFTGRATRKRIWEVDCVSLDGALAASFDWRELINILQGNGHSFDLMREESLLEFQAQCLIHEYCHSDNEVSRKIEILLNDWHQKMTRLFDRWTASEAAEYVLTGTWTKKSLYAGVFWALGTEARSGFDCIRRRFHQRFQLLSIRRIENK